MSSPLRPEKENRMTKGTITRRDLLWKGAAGTAIGAAALAFPTIAYAGASASSPPSAEVAKIYRLQARFHRAKSHQNIDLMMSCWAKDATFNTGGTILHGAAEIRSFFLGSGSWLHLRMSFVPSFKDVIDVDCDSAFLYFECHDVALTDESPTIPAGTLVTHLFNAGALRRNGGGNWVFQDMTGGPAPLSVDTIYFPEPRGEASRSGR
jgi:hypothetical protein